MNSDLAKEKIYPKTQQKQITAWLGIRNDSAHAHYDKYSEEEVKIMVMGLQDFFLRYPA